MSLLGDVGGLVGGLAAVGSVFMAWRTVKLSSNIAHEQSESAKALASAEADRAKALSKETSASAIYDAYLRCCIEYPHLTSFNVFRTTTGVMSAQAVWDAETKETEQYLWFVSYLLHACEGILVDASDKEDWMKAIRDQLGYHRSLIEFAWQPYWRAHYSDELDKQVQSLLSDARSSVAEAAE